MTSWENESLYKIFTKIRDTMPPNFGTTSPTKRSLMYSLTFCRPTDFRQEQRNSSWMPINWKAFRSFAKAPTGRQFRTSRSWR